MQSFLKFDILIFVILSECQFGENTHFLYKNMQQELFRLVSCNSNFIVVLTFCLTVGYLKSCLQVEMQLTFYSSMRHMPSCRVLGVTRVGNRLHVRDYRNW